MFQSSKPLFNPARAQCKPISSYLCIKNEHLWGFQLKNVSTYCLPFQSYLDRKKKKEAIIHLTISKGSENIIDGGDGGQSFRTSPEHESDPLNCFLLNLNKCFLCLELTLSQNSSLFPPSSHNF